MMRSIRQTRARASLRRGGVVLALLVLTFGLTPGATPGTAAESVSSEAETGLRWPWARTGTSALPGRQAPGRLVWAGDASRPVEEEWASLATATECAVVTRPGQQSQRVAQLPDASSPSPTGRLYRLEVRASDECYSQRAELGQGNPVKRFSEGDRLFREGESRWISFAHRLPASYPLGEAKWSLLHQWKQTASFGGEKGYPILSMTAYRDRYRLWGPGWSELQEQNPPTGAYGSWGVDFAQSPSKERWHLFSMHVVWSPDPAVGYVALYGDLADGRGWRTLVPGRHVATMKRNDEGGAGEAIPVHARTGVYRDGDHTGDTSLDVAGYAVGSTRTASEARAFRPELRPGR